jgi:hypothetical protein
MFTLAFGGPQMPNQLGDTLNDQLSQVSAVDLGGVLQPPCFGAEVAAPLSLCVCHDSLGGLVRVFGRLDRQSLGVKSGSYLGGQIHDVYSADIIAHWSLSFCSVSLTGESTLATGRPAVKGHDVFCVDRLERSGRAARDWSAI